MLDFRVFLSKSLPHLNSNFWVPEESLALPPEFDSFCVRHSPANEQVINEEFPGANFGAFCFFFFTGHHQDLLVKTGENRDVFQGTFFGWTWDLLTLEVWWFCCCSSIQVMHPKKTVFKADSPDPDNNFPDALFFFLGLRGKNGFELDAHLEMKSRILQSPIGTLTVIGMNT